MPRSFQTLLTFTLLLVFVVIDVVDVDAQRRRRRVRQVEEETVRIPFQQRLWYNIEIGNIGFGGDFTISTKFSAGYKITDRFSIGPASKLYYYFDNRLGAEDESFFDYGFGVLSRVKITDNIYLQGEYDWTSFDLGPIRESTWYPLVGAGYHEGRGPWTFGLSVLFILDEDVRDITNNTVEYWLSFTYNF